MQKNTERDNDMHQALEIYVHIPFCRSKCRYCDFVSWPERDGNRIAQYFEALKREIAAFNGGLQPIRSVYFGGGTPSAVAPAYLAETIAALEKKFGFDFPTAAFEKTIEVNPKTVDKNQLQYYRKLGFNRLSVGVQSFNDHLLKTIGRLHTAEEAAITLQDAAAAGFDNISVDLIFGLPGQTLADVDATIDRLSHFPPVVHVSCYSLIVEPGTVFERWQREGRLSLPSEKIERAMYHRICERLGKNGFAQYEISNFARPGCFSRHNSGYWDLTPYAGFGLGAASLLLEKRTTDADGAFRRWTTTPDFEAYLKNPVTRTENHPLSKREAEGDFMFLGLRKTCGVDDRDFQNTFGESFETRYADEIPSLIREGLIQRADTRIKLTVRGLDLANQVFMAFV